MAQSKSRTVLITGGAGFIGSNLAERLLDSPETRVRIFDDLSRPGVLHNLRWLLQHLPGRDRLEFMQGDLRDADAVQSAVREANEIYHLCGPSCGDYIDRRSAAGS